MRARLLAALAQRSDAAAPLSHNWGTVAGTCRHPCAAARFNRLIGLSPSAAVHQVHRPCTDCLTTGEQARRFVCQGALLQRSDTTAESKSAQAASPAQRRPPCSPTSEPRRHVDSVPRVSCGLCQYAAAMPFDRELGADASVRCSANLRPTPGAHRGKRPKCYELRCRGSLVTSGALVGKRWCAFGRKTCNRANRRGNRGVTPSTGHGGRAHRHGTDRVLRGAALPDRHGPEVGVVWLRQPGGRRWQPRLQ